MKFSKLLFILGFIISIAVNAQSEFKGKILYKVDFEIEHPNISKEMLYEEFGTGAIFLYDNGKYYQEYFDGATEFDIMDSTSGIYYNKKKNNDTIFVSDPSFKTDQSLIDIEEGSSSEIVLGYQCDFFKINVNIDSINQKYYLKFFFTKEIPIDGSRFENIKKGFANITYGKMNAIPIKFEIGDEYFKMIATASEIDESYKFDIDQIIKEKLKSYPKKNLN